ncbi:hypothetical protein CES86_3109 [Brucella lupini]|uniref:Uncharacterized protein n=1 Tax=Brucella lupini TaxID=255457 RepID=A0A256GMD1_9HYPH|nr:hypothetical protein CES86_3109 [Brucella lupini]
MQNTRRISAGVFVSVMRTTPDRLDNWQIARIRTTCTIVA